MKQFFDNIKGDKAIWSVAILLAIFSFMPVFSASSNLAYMNKGTGNTVAYLAKHFAHLALGFFILYRIQKIPYHRFRFISKILLLVSCLLLVITMFAGVEQGSAHRWLRVPILGVTFQPSSIASIALMMFVARYLAKNEGQEINFKQSLLHLWLPIGGTLVLILPNNFSTAALIFVMIVMLVFVGRYPAKYLAAVCCIAGTSLLFFILTAKIVQKTNPENPPRIFVRVQTWENRIYSFVDNKKSEDKEKSDEDYQIEKAKTAIASGGIYGLGQGKSVQKHFLPQSSSDFIFAIIVEEGGLIFGIGVLILYMFLFLRFVIAAHKANTLFGKLLVVGLGFPIIFQALINMCVAVQLLPVTGQTLPLISSGGSAIWMTCVSIGIIISVTKKDDEVAAEIADKEKRDQVLKKLIDEQMARDERLESEMLSGVNDVDDDQDSYSIEEPNPMKAVLHKK
jgi:cell division protein FtsW